MPRRWFLTLACASLLLPCSALGVAQIYVAIDGPVSLGQVGGFRTYFMLDGSEDVPPELAALHSHIRFDGMVEIVECSAVDQGANDRYESIDFTFDPDRRGVQVVARLAHPTTQQTEFAPIYSCVVRPSGCIMDLNPGRTDYGDFYADCVGDATFAVDTSGVRFRAYCDSSSSLTVRYGPPCGGDVNKDGEVSVDELVRTVRAALEGCPTP